MKLSEYLEKTEILIDKLIGRHKNVSNSTSLIAFRGENRDYGPTKLMPSLFRNPEYVLKEKYLFELLGDYSFLQKGQERNIEKAIEAQHYVGISRMLDITFCLLTAIFFACSGEKNEDGIVYIFCFPKHYSPHSQYIEDFYSRVLENNNISYPSNFKVISHSYSNDRIKAQKGGFIFYPGKDYRAIPNIYYEKICIDRNDKVNILKELDLVFNMNEATIFPEKERIIDVIRSKFNESIYQNYSITINGEIEAYFERINYELNLKTFENDIELIRFLRKEKDDLIFYVRTYCRMNDDLKTDLKKMIATIEENFDFLILKNRKDN